MGDPMSEGPDGYKQPGDPGHDPYQPPRADVDAAYYGFDQESARAAVATPAIVLAVLAGLHLALGLCGTFQNVLALAGVIPRQEPDWSALPPEMQQWRPMVEAMSNPAIALAGNAFSLAMGALVLVGALQLRSLGNYALALIGAIVAVIPCTSPCCCVIGMPVGIWCLVVMNRPEVREAFGRG
jgi:hypothetical protein